MWNAIQGALGAYRPRLATLRQELESLATHATQAGEESLALRAREAAERVAPRPFRIAFVGEFKAGKSTLVNALIGREVLAVAARECTTVVTRVRNASGPPTATGRRASGAAFPLTLQAAQEASVRREQEADPLVEVELTLPDIDWLDADVELVDTPGTGAVGRVRELVTLGWLPNADAVVFVTRADQLLNASEVTFLQENVLSIHPAGLFVVINHKDAIHTARDRAALEARAKERLAGVGSPTVHWTSAADAMDAIEAITEVYGKEEPDDHDVAEWQASGVPALRDALRVYLARDRVGAELERHQRTLSALKGELEARLHYRLRIAELDDEGVQRERERSRQLEVALRRVAVELRAEVSTAFATECRPRLDEVVRSATLQADHLLAEETDPGQASRRLEAHGTRVFGQMQKALGTSWSGIRERVSVRLIELEGRAIAGQGDAKVRSAVGPLDLGRTLRVESQWSEVVEQRQVDGGGSDGAAAAMGTFIGYAVAGPVGGLVGAWIGMTVGQQGAFETVRRQVAEQVVDRSNSVVAFRYALEIAADRAVQFAEQATLEALDRAMEDRLAELAAFTERAPKLPAPGVANLRATAEAVARLGVDAG